MTTFRELLAHFGGLKTVDPVVVAAWDNTLRAEAAIGDRSPHGRKWHVSFHASEFPGTDEACPRAAAYKMMDVGASINTERWLNQTAEVGKAIELAQVRRVRDDGRLCRSNIDGMSTDPDARDENGEEMPQIGFIDTEHWLTGSVDMALLPFNVENRPHIVEVKTKHEAQIAEMQQGLRGANPEHVRQARCSLGMAHNNPGAFLHPTEDRIMDVPVDGSIYYIARDSKWQRGNSDVPTHEFLIEHDQEFMEAGYEQLKRFKQAFLDDELVQTVEFKNKRSHPLGLQWSKGMCQYCPCKRICKEDYQNGTIRLSETVGVEQTTALRPTYDGKQARQDVLDFWEEQTNPSVQEEGGGGSSRDS